MEFTRQEQFDAYVDLILAVRQEGTTKAAEEAERRKTAHAPKNKKKSARKAAALEWARKSLEAERAKDRSVFKPKTMTEEDVAAAAGGTRTGRGSWTPSSSGSPRETPRKSGSRTSGSRKTWRP